MYLIRLDDASECMNVRNWDRVEALLDKHNVKPLVGVIPNNQDTALVLEYQRDPSFWDKVQAWDSKGWSIALHGYNHVCSSTSGGINPVNNRSEFAGLPLDVQREKIKAGMRIFNEHRLNPKIFFAPSHTFDTNTLSAIEMECNIRAISDTIANDMYKRGEFYFIPVQIGHFQRLPFRLTTICCHPNTMTEQYFHQAEAFMEKNRQLVINIDELQFKDRKPNPYDLLLSKMYFSIRRLRAKGRT